MSDVGGKHVARVFEKATCRSRCSIGLGTWVVSTEVAQIDTETSPLKPKTARCAGEFKVVVSKCEGNGNRGLAHQSCSEGTVV